MVLIPSVQETRELSEVWNFETRVLDLCLYGRGVGICGFLWCEIAAQKNASGDDGLPVEQVC